MTLISSDSLRIKIGDSEQFRNGREDDADRRLTYTRILSTIDRTTRTQFHGLVGNVRFQKNTRDENVRTFCLHAVGGHTNQFFRDLHTIHIAARFC